MQLERGRYEPTTAGLIEVGDFFTLVSMKLPNFCEKAKF
jgi:hypothetical protein